MKKIRQMKRKVLDYLRYIPKPKDSSIAFAEEFPQAGKTFQVHELEAISNSEAQILTRNVKRVYEVTNIFKCLSIINVGDAYYYTFFPNKSKETVYLAIANTAPVIGQRFRCSKLEFDGGKVMAWDWTTDFVSYVNHIESAYADDIWVVKTRHNSWYFVLKLSNS